MISFIWHFLCDNIKTLCQPQPQSSLHQSEPKPMPAKTSNFDASAIWWWKCMNKMQKYNMYSTTRGFTGDTVSDRVPLRGCCVHPFCKYAGALSVLHGDHSLVVCLSRKTKARAVIIHVASYSMLNADSTSEDVGKLPWLYLCRRPTQRWLSIEIHCIYAYIHSCDAKIWRGWRLPIQTPCAIDLRRAAKGWLFTSELDLWSHMWPSYSRGRSELIFCLCTGKSL